MLNVNDTIISQYANSPILLALIQSMDDSIDPSVDIDLFYDMVWNIDTAEGWGLDAWGRIVGVSRIIQIPDTTNYLNFEESTDPNGFNQMPWFGGTPSSSNYALSDDAFRVLILARAFFNVSRCSIEVYNIILMQLFPGRGNAYVCDIGNMVSRITTEFTLEPFEILILQQSNVFAPPTGVRFDIMDVAYDSTFGFAEANSGAGFNNGVFFEGYE